MRRNFYIVICILYVLMMFINVNFKSFWWLSLMGVALLVVAMLIFERKFTDEQAPRKKTKWRHYFLTWFLVILGLTFLVSAVSYFIHFDWYRWFQPLFYALIAIGLAYSSRFEK